MSALRSSLALALVLGSGNAYAVDDLVYEDMPTGYVRVFGYSLPAGSTTTFTTTNLSPGADSVLHLACGSSVRLSNDDWGGALTSRIQWTNTTGSTANCSLILHSFNMGSGGTADVRKNGIMSYGGAIFGGTSEYVPCSGGYRWETAQIPGGTTNPILLGLTATGTLVSWDRSSGVGADARLPASGQVCKLIIGAEYGSGTGNVALYGNDYLLDADGDGLGAALEAQLGTCDLARDCPDVFNPADTDRDGLTDGAEVFGIESATAPVYLPRWGADPVHKDIFIEVDWVESVAGNPFTGDDAREAQAYFDVAPADSVQNPDGRDGVSLHFDIGMAPVDPADAALYGDWGGANAVPDGTDYGVAPSTWRAASREGVFHYALKTLGDGGGQGVAAGDRLHWEVGTSGSNHVSTFVHELGHNVALAHHGHDDWGPVNCKPNYGSLMNYGSPVDGFSLGTNTVVLDPDNLSEPMGLGGDVSWLSGSSWQLGVVGDAVDWSGDGVISSSKRVRAAVNWATWDGCGTAQRNRQVLAAETYASTPDMVHRGERLYSFWVGTDSKIHYRQGLVTAFGDDGSCPGGDQDGDECMSWGADTLVATSKGAKGVTAVELNGRVTLAYRSSVDSVRVLTATGADSAGTLTGWTSEQWIGSAYTVAEPEITLLQVDQARFGGASQVLAVLYRAQADDTYRWITASSGTGTWTSRGNLLDGAGAAVRGTVSPTIATMPDGRDSISCGAFTDTASNVAMYCYDKAANRWLREADDFATEYRPTTSVKPGVAWHQPRSSDGQLLSANASQGQLWVAVGRTDASPLLLQTGSYDDTSSPLGQLTFTRTGKFDGTWGTLQPGTGVALFEDLQISALKGLYVPSDDDQFDLTFLPFADGTWSMFLTDGDDFTVMERGICRGIADDTLCGAETDTVWGY